jgi:hypothetical protein
MTFARIEEQGLEAWLAGLRAELVRKLSVSTSFVLQLTVRTPGADLFHAPRQGGDGGLGRLGGGVRAQGPAKPPPMGFPASAQ